MVYAHNFQSIENKSLLALTAVKWSHQVDCWVNGHPWGGCCRRRRFQDTAAPVRVAKLTSINIMEN